MPIPKPPYPAEFRRQMVELVQAGRTPTQLAAEFDCSAQSISNWVAQAAADSGKPVRGKDVDQIPGIIRDGKTLVERDPEGGLAPVFWDAEAQGIYRRMVNRRATAPGPSNP